MRHFRFKNKIRRYQKKNKVEDNANRCTRVYTFPRKPTTQKIKATTKEEEEKQNKTKQANDVKSTY